MTAVLVTAIIFHDSSKNSRASHRVRTGPQIPRVIKPKRARIARVELRLHFNGFQQSNTHAKKLCFSMHGIPILILVIKTKAHSRHFGMFLAANRHS